MAGAFEEDVLVVDRSITPIHKKIASVDGFLTVKRLYKRQGKVMLLPENDNYKPIVFNQESDLVIWGVVTAVTRKL